MLSQLAPAPASYEWLFELLVGQTPVVSWAVAGDLPDAFERAEQFAVLPAGGDRGFMVSLASRPAAVSALTSYNALRTPRKRLARSMLAIGLRAGLRGALPGSRIDVGIAAQATAADLSEALISDYLRRLFDRDEVVVAFGGGSGPYRKPVLQVFAADGSPLGYVKVGWNAWSRDAVGREATALAACAARPMRLLGVPALIDRRDWRGLDLVVTAPLPAGVRRLGRGRGLPDAAVLRGITELTPGHTGPLAASPYWRGIRARIDALAAASASASWLSAAADSIELARGDEVLSFGSWHGDLVPWNLARLRDRVYAWDWESSAPDAPVGFDAVHYYFQVAFVAGGTPLAQATALARRQAGPALRALGVAAGADGLLGDLHLLELALRHELAQASTGDCDDRFYPAITTLLRADERDQRLAS